MNQYLAHYAIIPTHVMISITNPAHSHDTGHVASVKVPEDKVQDPVHQNYY